MKSFVLSAVKGFVLFVLMIVLFLLIGVSSVVQAFIILGAAFVAVLWAAYMSLSGKIKVGG